MSIDQFLGSLKKVRKVGDGKFFAVCPVHDDKNPSLSVSVEPNGKVIMRCFGCGASGLDVCSALGLEASSLFPPSDNPKYEKQARSGFSAWQLVYALRDDLIRLVVIANYLKDIKGLPDDDRKFVAELAIRLSEGLSHLEGVNQ